MMQYDYEMPVATMFAQYLLNQCATGPGGILDQSLCPIVTFFDPMSVDPEDRVVIFVPTGETDSAIGGNFLAEVEIYQKTQWSQIELQQNFSTHYARLKELRDKLFPINLASRLAPFAPSGLAIDYVNQKKSFATKIVGDEGGFIDNRTMLTIQGHFTVEN
jgi:hypothetical protein